MKDGNKMWLSSKLFLLCRNPTITPQWSTKHVLYHKTARQVPVTRLGAEPRISRSFVPRHRRTAIIQIEAESNTTAQRCLKLPKVMLFCYSIGCFICSQLLSKSRPCCLLPTPPPRWEKDPEGDSTRIYQCLRQSRHYWFRLFCGSHR